LNKYTYIIGYKHSTHQLSNLLKTIDWLNRLDNLDVIVIEADRHSKISNLNISAKHIFIETHNPNYNRSWVFNVGLKYCNTPNVIFGNCDIIMDYEPFLESLKLLNKYEFIAPYEKINRLDKYSSSQLNVDIFSIETAVDFLDANLTNGICFFQTESIKKIGGWCELFEGYGYEDIGLDILIKHKLNWYQCNNHAYHLYHPIEQIDAEFYSKNAKLYSDLVKMSDVEIDRFINTVQKNIGRLNRYI